jgi:peptidoglycan/LPS O-acetylase OafA/YrhL
LRAAAVIQGAESVLVLVATILAGVDAAAGQSYHASSGIALTVIGVAAVAALALVAAGLVRARRWSRTPALLTQLFAGIVGIYLLQGHRLDWGLALLVLAVLGFAALLAPPSLRALTSEQDPPEPPATKPSAGKPASSKSTAGKPAGSKSAPGKPPGSKPPAGKRPTRRR